MDLSDVANIDVVLELSFQDPTSLLLSVIKSFTEDILFDFIKLRFMEYKTIVESAGYDGQGGICVFTLFYLDENGETIPEPPASDIATLLTNIISGISYRDVITFILTPYEDFVLSPSEWTRLLASAPRIVELDIRHFNNRTRDEETIVTTYEDILSVIMPQHDDTSDTWSLPWSYLQTLKICSMHYLRDLEESLVGVLKGRFLMNGRVQRVEFHHCGEEDWELVDSISPYVKEIIWVK